MRLVLIGPQGSGKGTQAKIISKKLKIPHISTGDLLRNLRGELKQKVDRYVNRGELIPDELMIEILKDRISKPDCKKGFLLDGFPRNLRQAKELNKLVEIDKVFEISIPDEEAIRRISGRRNCENCGEIYNINTSPKPKQDGICDKCGGRLYQREDDNEKAVKKRLEIYHKETEPVLKYYNTIKINGKQDIEKVTDDILKELDV